MEKAPLLDARDLGFGYGRTRVWEHIDLALHAGDIAFLVGPNGAGKTTLLKCLAGWMNPTEGSIEVMGEAFDGSVQHLRRQISYIADVPAFYDDLTAREHVDFLLRANDSGPERLREADELLQAFGIERSCGRYPSAFSRGMRQKLACVLGLLTHPRILIMDEPTGPLDPAARDLLSDLIIRAVAEGTAILMSCHHDLPGIEPDAKYELSDGSLRLLAGGLDMGEHDGCPR